jgi:hypothetical protein
VIGAVIGSVLLLVVALVLLAFFLHRRRREADPLSEAKDEMELEKEPSSSVSLGEVFMAHEFTNPFFSTAANLESETGLWMADVPDESQMFAGYLDDEERLA